MIKLPTLKVFETRMPIIFKNTIETMYASTIEVMSPLTTKQVYKAIVQEAANLVGADFGSIFIAKNGKLKIVYTTVPIKRRITPRVNGNASRAYKNNELVVLNKQEIKIAHPEALERNIKSIIIIPLSANGKSLGVLTLQSSKHEYFDNKKINILKLFGSVASLKIQQVELWEQVKADLEIRDQFTALASHEIKTPLAVISMYSSLLEQKLEKGEPLKKEWIETISRQSLRINQIINEFLNIKAVRAGFNYNFEKCNIITLMSTLLKHYSVTYPDQKINCKILLKNNHGIVLGDKDKLTHVFTNILNNAIKFCNGNSILITMSKIDQEAVVEIEDKGVGIAESDLPHIFDPFYQGKNKKAGMGMGLYLSKNIINAHKGRIEVKSQVGEGTKVTIKLPQYYVRTTQKTRKQTQVA